LQLRQQWLVVLIFRAGRVAAVTWLAQPASIVSERVERHPRSSVTPESRVCAERQQVRLCASPDIDHETLAGFGYRRGTM